VRKAGAYKPPHLKKTEESISLSDLRGALNDRSSRSAEGIESKGSEDLKQPRRVGTEKGTSNKMLESIEKDFKAYFNETHTSNEEFREITKTEAKHDLTKHQLLNVLIPALFHSDNIAGKVKARKPLLKQFIFNYADQILLLRAWERYYVRDEDALSSSILHVMKSLYETDLVEEEAFLTWAEPDASATSFRHKIKPFIDWLKTADEED